MHVLYSIRNFFILNLYRNGICFIIGTIQHLKNKLGAGFNLEMNLQSEDRVTAAQQYVQINFSHAVENERFGKFISFRVPMIDVQSLGRVFERLEAGKPPEHITLIYKFTSQQNKEEIQSSKRISFEIFCLSQTARRSECRSTRSVR